MRERFLQTGAETSTYQSKSGRFMPHQRLNVDQTPLPFSFDTKKRYELVEPDNPEKRIKKVWVDEPYPGASKRFCSFNVCFRSEREQIGCYL